jgi:two-component sensor histidine kinase
MAYGIRVGLEGVYHYPFLTFIVAILVASIFLSHGAGLLATLLGALLAPRFFTVQVDIGFWPNDTSARIALVAFVVFGFFTASTIGALRTTVVRLHEANQRLVEAKRRLELAERVIRASDTRKGVLLADINHRLKNSLQAVGGILSAEGKRAGDAAARAALADAAGRLRILAQVHERLHLSGNGSTSSICTRDFIGALCADLRTTLVGVRPIIFHTNVEDIKIDVLQAVPVGLIVNEAVTNAVRHAFSDGCRGLISVRLERSEAGWLRLEVADNGSGSPAVGPGAATGGGTRLIHALARQLGGEAEWHGPPGTAIIVKFPEALTIAPTVPAPPPRREVAGEA